MEIYLNAFIKFLYINVITLKYKVKYKVKNYIYI